ncbi:porin family protein [Flavobacterium pallidum]|uniref:Outer membrane protein beta-barrel domain-containing protein n=1 Tax=Flavobacterium pallidum TaxID=2172098 RepID=A0A2S1SJM6_9FLAO|nr:porin family protein [Flavobacterium pallidum]AWI26569.1 hypothetical protein HYN49_12060 [Flavobacterium pallidum]
MKKLLITAIVFCGCTLGVLAQAKGDIELAFGTGVNFSTARTSENQADTKTGFNVSAGADFYFSDRWSIKAKLYYDQKGWNNGYITDGSNYLITDFRLNYLTVPVMANWHFGKKRNWYLNFGPYAGFLLKAEATNYDLDVKDYYKSNDFGLALGIGVKIPVSDKLKFFIEYDEQAGFSEILQDDFGNGISNDRGAFNIGLNFLLK